MPRGELIQRVWNYKADERTLHTHIQRLRRKLAAAGRQYLQTVWGVGYRFVAGGAES